MKVYTKQQHHEVKFMHIFQNFSNTTSTAIDVLPNTSISRILRQVIIQLFKDMIDKVRRKKDCKHNPEFSMQESGLLFQKYAYIEMVSVIQK